MYNVKFVIYNEFNKRWGNVNSYMDRFSSNGWLYALECGEVTLQWNNIFLLFVRKRIRVFYKLACGENYREELG